MAPPADSTSPLPELPRRPGIGALRLTVVEGVDQGISQLFHQPRVLIGRGETADLRLTDKTVSACHCELQVADQLLLLNDLESRNGVQVGAVAVQRGLVRPGCVLTLGGTSVRVDAAGERQSELSTRTALGGLQGASSAMRELYTLLERLAPTDLSVLIQGETGTGKELAARTLHALGRRAGGPLVVLDCTTIPPGLAASALFGHEKGAFTGATERRIGAFEAAHHGVLFIDEIGELAPDIQPMLLRALAERVVVPVGSTRPKTIDLRVIAASWRDLRALVNQGKFREDLYFRIAQVTAWMPSLAERREDIPLLVRHILHEQQARSDGSEGFRGARDITAEAMAELMTMAFPGNVRELRSVVERLALLSAGEVITTADLRFERLLVTARSHPAATAPAHRGPLRASVPAEDTGPYKDARRSALDDFERQYLQRLLQRCGDNLSHAAAAAGLARHNLRDLLRRHGLYEREKLP